MLLHPMYASQAMFSLEYFTAVRKLFRKFTKLENPQRRPILPLCVPIWKGSMDQKDCTKQNNNEIFSRLRNISGCNNFKLFLSLPIFLFFLKVMKLP
jgi:hypothetical protein